jgi:hypothetical protein
MVVVRTVLVAAFLGLVIALAPSREARPAAAAGGASGVWMSTTCAAIKTLQDDGLNGSARLSAAPSRSSLARLLKQVDSDALRLETATAKPLPGVTKGSAISALLYGDAAGFHAYLAGRRAALAHGSGNAVAVGAAVARRSRAIGADFVRIGSTFHSPELDSAIDQAPQCALVHG